MILKRKISLILISILSSVGSLMAQTGSFSWGALDMVGASGDMASGDDVASVVLERLVSSSGQVATGALDMLLGTTSGVSAGPLDYIRTSQSATGYYSAGDFGSPVEYAYASASLWGGRMSAPSSWGRITSGFGYRPRFGRMHKGIDIALCVGDTVRVPVAGTVDRVGYEAGGYGNYVVVKHDDGFETRYAHLQVSLVDPGQRVYEYQPIALSGNTGNSTGPHLHFETRINGEAIDPRNFFDFSGGRMVARSRRVDSTMGVTSRDGIGALDQVRDHSLSGKSLEERRTYVVKAGDTLQKIAGRAGVSVRELCRLNMISESDQLKPGTMIRLKR